MMKTNTDQEKEIWIGMIEVRPFDDSKLLADVNGAFVNVLTWAINLEEFRRKVEELMNYLHLDIVGMEKAEPLANRGPEDELDDAIRHLAAEVRYNPDAIRHSSFHTWGDGVQ